MTTLANVRAALRRVLEDTDAAAYLWADAELSDFLRTSLGGYSQLVPRQLQHAAVANGATDNGAPGLRPHYTPTYYAAFVIDPDGNNLEFVCHNG